MISGSFKHEEKTQTYFDLQYLKSTKNAPRMHKAMMIYQRAEARAERELAQRKRAEAQRARDEVMVMIMIMMVMVGMR